MKPEEKLNALKEGLTKARDLRLKAETKKDALQKQHDEILEQIRAEQVDPERLDEEIQKLETDIEALTNEIRALIPWDLIKKGE